MHKLKKWALIAWGILSAILTLGLTVWALMREMSKNKLQKEDVDRLRSSLNTKSKENKKAIQEAVTEIKVTKKIMKAEEVKLSKMSLKEKVAHAKKHGY
jgi:hypothetical protein